eukprot:TRINITY_DN5030_c0_g1_i1.p1 TRINITY_DN5030_c0_g1~~TRINITY_DN5030_c0_g1_i1.p1  ORF type:complete len:488 (+),score=151.97 TRINITY_DN5030_c0_g1_i1:301-1764(+)
MKTVHRHGPGCPCHMIGCSPQNLQYHRYNQTHPHENIVRGQMRTYSSTARPQNDYAFEMATSTIRYGAGATREVGMDVKDMGAKHVVVFCDPALAKFTNSPVNTVLQSLHDQKVKYSLYDRVRVEPTDSSFKEAIEHMHSQGPFDAIIAVGGGSVIDTAKAANLYSSHPPKDFLDYVNPPIGKGLPVPGALKPLIAIPTTAGTGSETTGVAIFDMESMNAKTGIGSRLMKPTLGIVDPLNTLTCPKSVTIAASLDQLCHSLESYTAIPYTSRPLMDRPALRPAYQGSNPISDVWCMKALEMIAQYLPLVIKNPLDIEARSELMLAATYAGIGFGNAGVHLCHGMSYAVSGLAKDHVRGGEGYPDIPLVPHGISVCINAPSVFEFTGPAAPERHRHAAKILYKATDPSKAEQAEQVSDADAGKYLSDAVKSLMKQLGVPNGLHALGYSSSDIPALVKGTLPQHRVIKLSPRRVEEDDLTKLFENAMRY